MRPAPRVYGIDLHLDKSGSRSICPIRWSPENLWVTARPRNLTSRRIGPKSDSGHLTRHLAFRNENWKWTCRRSISGFVRSTGKRQFQHDRGGLVSTRRREQIPNEPRFKTANEEWKAKWSDLLSWSTMFAVALHAAAFAFWPSWDTLDPLLESDLELLDTEIAWISFYDLPSSGGGGVVASLAVLEEPDSLPDGLDARTTLGGSAWAGVAFSGRLRERLVGRGGPVPTLVEPPVSAPPDLGDDSANTPEEEGDGLRVAVEDHTIADLASRLETSTLDLSRLAGLRPELVLPGTTMWLLLRNPEEVKEFMRVSRIRGAAEGEGQVGVTVWIDERGSVEWSEITRSSGRQELDESALALFNEVVSF